MSQAPNPAPGIQIRHVADRFVADYGNEFAVYLGKWYRLDHGRNMWEATGARYAAQERLQECAASLWDGEKYQWVLDRAEQPFTVNRIMLHITQALEARNGIPGNSPYADAATEAEIV